MPVINIQCCRKSTLCICEIAKLQICRVIMLKIGSKMLRRGAKSEKKRLRANIVQIWFIKIDTVTKTNIII